MSYALIHLLNFRKAADQKSANWKEDFYFLLCSSDSGQILTGLNMICPEMLRSKEAEFFLFDKLQRRYRIGALN